MQIAVNMHKHMHVQCLQCPGHKRERTLSWEGYRHARRLLFSPHLDRIFERWSKQKTVTCWCGG